MKLVAAMIVWASLTVGGTEIPSGYVEVYPPQYPLEGDLWMNPDDTAVIYIYVHGNWVTYPQQKLIDKDDTFPSETE